MGDMITMTDTHRHREIAQSTQSTQFIQCSINFIKHEYVRRIKKSAVAVRLVMFHLRGQVTTRTIVRAHIGIVVQFLSIKHR